MRYIFLPHGEFALSSFSGSKTLFAFDFDGTLAPIVPQPDAAYAPAEINAEMRRLSDVAAVAIVTGRSIYDMSGRIDFKPKYIVGNHGAEGLPGELLHKTAPVEIIAWENQLRAVWHDLPQGINLENKGYSLSLHYRMATDQNAARLALEGAIKKLIPPPRSIGGKCVINLLPVKAADKFDALLALQHVENASHVIFVGDDETDETVFRKALPQWITIRVGHEDNSAAAYYLKSQSEMAALIQQINFLVREQREDLAQ